MQLLPVIFPIIAIAVLGYLLANRGFMSKSETDAVSKFTFNIPIPILLFTSTVKLSLPETFDYGFLLSFYLAVVLVFIIAVVISKYLFIYNYKGQSAYGVGAVYSNTTVVGIPVCLQALGPESILPLFIIISIQSLFIFSIGMLMAERQGLSLSTISGYLLRILSQILKSPITIGLTLGLLINILGVPLLPILDKAMTMLSDTAIPLALLVLGASLNNFKLTSQLLVPSVLVLLKNIILPVLVFLIATYLFQVNSLWTATAVTAAAMPIGISAYAYAKKYQSCEEEIASGIFMSTMSSLFTISLILAFML